MKKSFLMIVFIFMVPLMASSQSFHFPDKVTTPGFTHGNSFRLNLYIKPCIEENPNSDDWIAIAPQDFLLRVHPGFSMAYSPCDHWAITGSYNWLINNGNYTGNNGDNLDGDNIVYNGSHGELAVGYYTTYSKKGLLEVYCGYGNGSIMRSNSTMRITDPNYFPGPNQTPVVNADFTGRYHRFIAQVATGIKNGKVSMTGGVKYTMQSFYSFAYKTGTTDNYVPSEYRASAINNSASNYIQPYVDFTAGGTVAFNMQFGLVNPIEDAAIAFDNTAPYLTLGLCFKFESAAPSRY